MSLGDALGEICKAIFPIPEQCCAGNPDSAMAICTLSSMNLLRQIANSDVLDRISIAGRLLSENKGIDSLIRHASSHKSIRTILLCGNDTWGHKAGHSLVELYRNGTDDYNRIINSTSPQPFLTASQSDIDHFRSKIVLVNRMGLTDMKLIRRLVSQ